MPSRKQISRRQFLAACGGVASTALLSACGGDGTTPASQGAATTAAGAGAEPTVGAAPPAGAGQEIRFLVRSDIKSAYGIDAAVEQWNKEFESKIKLDEPAGDPSTKIQAAQAAGDLIWDGYAVMVSPWDTPQWVKRGLVQPIDEFIKASTVPDAGKVVPAIIPTILESTKFEGKQYAIPGNVGSIALAWQWDALKAAGLEQQPITWDEVHEAARKIKAAKPDLMPFDSAATPLCDLYAMIWGATDDPFTEEGLVDITSESSIAALKWMRTMVDERLMPSVHKESFQNWLKGGTGMITSYDVAGTMYQQTFGQESADTGINFFQTKGETKAGTPFWINSCVVLNKAKNPQGMTDFYLWFFGPGNKPTGKQMVEVAAKPCYQYTYDEFVVGRPEYHWEQEGIELVGISKPFPPNTYSAIEQEKTAPWVEKVLDPNQQVDPRQAMESALKEIKDEIAKQRS